jgi:hypothetical protein
VFSPWGRLGLQPGLIKKSRSGTRRRFSAGFLFVFRIKELSFFIRW